MRVMTSASVAAWVWLASTAHQTAAQAPVRSLSPTHSKAGLAVAPPESLGFSTPRLQRIDEVVTSAIQQKQLPGAVVLVGRGDRIIYHKAFGLRAVEPRAERMTRDTIFDLASLTKVVATTTAVMMLVEEGRIRLTDRLSTFIPECGRYGKEEVTVRHLLTHVSGLRPDIDLGDPWRGYSTAIARGCGEVLEARPGERFIYSDINFFLLGEVVSNVSGLSLDRFAAERIFTPLGMADTMFNPPDRLMARIAPTERVEEPSDSITDEAPSRTLLRGVVHDPTARRMGGVAGHAGLFSTAADLAVFCQMLLKGGSRGGKRLLSPLAVVKMTSPATPPAIRPTRGLGWDIDSPFSANRGELFPIGSFGHTGFTGTSIWIDPATETFIIFLSNRLHPDGKGDVTPLRARVATAVAAALVDSVRASRSGFWAMRPPMSGADFGSPAQAPVSGSAQVLTGLDELQRDGFKALQGKRVALLANAAAVNASGRSAIDVLANAQGMKLTALLAPEHGVAVRLDSSVASGLDPKTGLPIYSMYEGDRRRLTDEMLAGVDAIVIDLPDVGARFYTYATSMAFAMEDAAQRQIEVVVLDRPNLVNGWMIEGPGLEEQHRSFVGYFPGMPVRHGMTLGELARLFNAENKIGARLTVVSMKHWRRSLWFDEVGLPWVDPSPNMRTFYASLLYPGIGSIEWSNLSVGRGTDRPLEQVGAPWIDGVRLARELNARSIPGVRVYPVRFTPTTREYANEVCGGVSLVVTDRHILRPVRLGIEIAAALWRLYPDQYRINPDRSARLVGNRSVFERVAAGEDPAQIARSWGAAEARWRLLRGKYLLYD